MYLISAVLFLTSENSLKYPLPVPQTQYFLSSLWGYAFWRGLCFLQVAFVCFDFCLLYTYFPQMPDELFAHLYMWDTMEDFSATSSSGWFGFLILGLVGSPRSLPVPRLGPGRGDLGILAVTTQLFTDLPAWMPGLSGCPWLQCSLGRRRGFTAPRRVGREAQGFVCHLTLMFPASPFFLSYDYLLPPIAETIWGLWCWRSFCLFASPVARKFSIELSQVWLISIHSSAF